MPAVPKRRTPRSKGRSRRANSYRAPVLPALIACECGEMIRPYHVCPKCGSYRGEKVLEIKEK